MANGKKNKSKKKLFIFGGLGLLVVILIIVAFVGGGREEIIGVQTEKVVKRTITQFVTATGKINPEFRVIITPEVTGEIIALPVKEGDKVKKGDLLIRIKGDQYQAQKERLEATLMSAEANLKIREAELNRVTSDFSRVKELHSKGLASDSELEFSQSNYLSTQASYESAQASVLQSKASLREILDQLYKTTIVSPIDGTITQLNVEIGERVLGSGFTQGTNIMTVSDLSNIEAVVDVDENDVILVSIGDTAKIKVDAFGDKIFTGLVTQIGNSAKTAGFGTQQEVVNFEVKVKLIEPDESLRPGMSCNADIETETVADVLSIPIQSVTARTDIKTIPETDQNTDDEAVVERRQRFEKPTEIVFIIKEATAQSVEVETGISDDNYIQIISGLEGDEEVVSGSYRAISRELKDGRKVRVENRDSKKDSKEITKAD
ncbi:MAG TPA: efflux RND transporter periplasmic adaptor subunit [Ignavibacteriaceae bacterium]|nr:efflux RND transporter periplasmic adaptor subunit [Ignavibacteriaceae bacterium]